MIRILYFASLGERLGRREENLEAATVATVGDVVTQLKSRGATWADAFERTTVMSAVNQQMADSDTPVTDGDELAFFPPVTGG